jgi:hypothetical protein
MKHINQDVQFKPTKELSMVSITKAQVPMFVGYHY